jgi:predicted  nucleic acid-binding Zn-ribbon protein
MTQSTSSWGLGDAKGSGFEAPSIDLVRALRDLNSLDLDSSKLLPELESLHTSLRQKLPPDILAIHEKLVAQRKRSVAPRFANACTECSGEVVVARGAKRLGGMFVQCPHCGTLLYG